MAKRHSLNDEECDFGTGLQVSDPLGKMRTFQKDLYRLDNPYVGNKRKIVVDIAIALEKEDVEFNTMADVFSGSCVVGLFFKILGKQIFSNDLLTSSYMNAVSFVENPGISLSDMDKEFLCTNDNPNRGDFVRKNYVNRFTDREALFLDNYRANIETLIAKDFPDTATTLSLGRQCGKTTLVSESVKYMIHKAKIKEALAIVAIEHYIMNRCFLGGRLNNGQILAKLEHRLDHQRNAGDEMMFKLPTPPVFTGNNCRASNMDCLEFLNSIPDVDLCYLDPPYGGAQSDYASMFAFCEEYVYGVPIDELPHIANSKKFVSAKDFETHFRATLELATKKAGTIAVSFNDTSWADASKVKDILSDYKKSVKIVNIDHEYKYRKDRGDATEHLFIAR